MKLEVVVYHVIVVVSKIRKEKDVDDVNCSGWLILLNN